MRKAAFYTRLPGDWAWREVIQAYNLDRLEAAYEMTLSFGMGADGSRGIYFRRIEAEYLTRKASVQEKINDWLTVEYIPDQVSNPAALFHGIVEAWNEIAQRLSWTHGPPVMVSVIAEEVDAPWMPGRYGYFIHKLPYDKICIPNYLSHDPARLHSVVIHEYTHEIVQDLTRGKAPTWLNEMVAVTAQGGPSNEIVAKFASGQLGWLEPARLQRQFIREYDGQGQWDRYNAYQQSACIGKYLVDLKGEPAMGEMLRAFSDNSFLKELAMRAMNSSPSEEALKQVYGLGEKELFRRALAWVQSRR